MTLYIWYRVYSEYSNGEMERVDLEISGGMITTCIRVFIVLPRHVHGPSDYYSPRLDSRGSVEDVDSTTSYSHAYDYNRNHDP